ncbi:hypothetical protein [Bacillus halotolerans]|uniref:hypothetical protein n=1 Tax=Bacillus halotolerans TaxID=260554 RepID=UPI00192B6008|nr:hypothetical protein [Bacillus halotolerans]MBL4976300.1 hypothetical protein [Bacillus halotolerans]
MSVESSPSSTISFDINEARFFLQSADLADNDRVCIYTVCDLFRGKVVICTAIMKQLLIYKQT